MVTGKSDHKVDAYPDYDFNGTVTSFLRPLVRFQFYLQINW
jgi:hypothetical protein